MQNTYKSDKATGSSAVSTTVTFTAHALWEGFEIHLGAVGASGTLTITRDSVNGSTYDTVLFSQDMTSVTDVVYRPERPIPIWSGDKIVVAWANAGGKTYGLLVYWR